MGFANSDIVEIINQSALPRPDQHLSFDVLSASLDCTVKKQRMLWTAWIVDSFWSAGFRGRPSFDDNQIFDMWVPSPSSLLDATLRKRLTEYLCLSSCPFIPRMGDPLPRLEGLSSPQCFGVRRFFVVLFRRRSGADLLILPCLNLLAAPPLCLPDARGDHALRREPHPFPRQAGYAGREDRSAPASLQGVRGAASTSG